MKMFGFLGRKKSAPVARERLQVMLAHERASLGRSQLVARMRDDIVAVIASHVGVERNEVRVKVNRRDSMFVLKIDMDITPDIIPNDPRSSPQKAISAQSTPH